MTAASTAAILASVRPRNIRQGEPIALRTGFRKILWCSWAFHSAVEECRATTSVRACMSVGASSSPICSATRQPIATFSRCSLPLTSGLAASGLCSSVTLTTFDPDSSTYISRASRRSGAKPSVLPVYTRSSPERITALHSRVSSRTRLDRCSTTSWPLTASTMVRPEIFIATLSRSQPTSRLPSLTTAYAVSFRSSEPWIWWVNPSS